MLCCDSAMSLPVHAAEPVHEREQVIGNAQHADDGEREHDLDVGFLEPVHFPKPPKKLCGTWMRSQRTHGCKIWGGRGSDPRRGRPDLARLLGLGLSWNPTPIGSGQLVSVVAMR